MQKVSNEYKKSMKDILRERSYIMVSFGLINQEIQSKAKIGSGEFADYSKTDNLFGKASADTVYATLEENFTRVDGSMFFLPRNGSYYNTGLISKNLVSDGQFSLTINFNTFPTDFRGLTINFGENYPLDFDIMTDKGQKFEIRNNALAEFKTEEVFNKASKITLIFHRMLNPKSRLRIYSITFGYGLIYRNDSVINSTLESYVSPIGADIPQIDFSVTLKNYDKYFNVDNPNSAINFLETGQEMDIYYGYQVSDGIEWIKGNHLLCSEWESDDYSATIRCQDVFRNMDREYYLGKYIPTEKSYYDLAVDVLNYAGIKQYYIDPHLKGLYSKNPIPRVQCKEALQIIANACRCVLSQSRTGVIQIKSNFKPSAVISSNGEAAYSNVGNTLKDTKKVEYGSFATNYAVVDGSMHFIPRSFTGKDTGYVSKDQSDSSGKFVVNPMVTIAQEAACRYYGIRLDFGHSLPSGIIIRTYNNESLVDEYVVVEEITKKLSVIHDFDDFDKMQIEFTGTKEPFNRIVLNHFSFGGISDFTMTRRDMTSVPKAIKQEEIKEIIVSCYLYHTNSKEDSLTSEDVTAGSSHTFYFDKASYGYRATLNNTSNGVAIVAQGDFYITVKVNKTGKLEIFGHQYKVVERHATTKLKDKGKTIRWENPLISDMKMAQDLSNWLSEYYSSGIEYEYTTRGNPEIDANDIIYQENEFVSDMKVTVCRETVSFNQALSGKVTTRRLANVANT